MIRDRTKIPQVLFCVLFYDVGCGKNIYIKFIHFSTEAVFSGKKINKIYSENDKAAPGTIYGKSKYAADKKIIKGNVVNLEEYREAMSLE